MNCRSAIEKLQQMYGQRKSTFSENKSFFGYTKVVDTHNYSVYLPPYLCEEIIAAHGTAVVTQKKKDPNVIYIYPYYQAKNIKHKVFLSERFFPGLIKGSGLLLCMFVPYMRNVCKGSYVKSQRLVIITDKGQIYHNYPSREKDCDGFSIAGDTVRFEESVIWDLPERKHPSQSKAVSDLEIYYPNLPKECYEYHPMLNTERDFCDKYGNGGFGKEATVRVDGATVKVSRFYMYSRDVGANPFFYMGRGDFDEKMCVIGTYRSNVDMGVRNCVFASSDGGRTWFCKYEFADSGEYKFRQGETEKWGRNFGNPIKNDAYDNCDCSDIKVSRRVLNVPNEKEKEPKTKFVWQDIGLVKEITSDDQLTIKTREKHSLITGNIIVFSSKTNESKLEWMLNNGYTENKAGNGMLFKVEVLDEFSFRVYELVSNPYNNIPCRHIHHINRIKDGWLIGTGEIYPNGWLFYMQMRETDTFSVKNASDDFKIIRLNSSERSVQRTLGAVFYDDVSRTMIYASDHDTLEQKSVKVTAERTNKIMRGSTGVYKGALDNIDDRNSFEAIYEAKEPCFFFQQLDNMFVFCGQRGELAISFDKGKTWHQEKLPLPVIRYRGCTFQYYYFDSCIIKRK